MFILFLVSLFAFFDTSVLIATKVTVTVKESIIKKQAVQDKEHLNSVEDREFKKQFQA